MAWNAVTEAPEAGNPTEALGAWLLDKWRSRLEDAGDAFTVARQMKKQGIPLEVARFVLLERGSAGAVDA